MKKYLIIVALVCLTFGVAFADDTPTFAAPAALGSLSIAGNGFSQTLDPSSADASLMIATQVPSDVAALTVQAGADNATVDGTGFMAIGYGTNLIPLNVVGSDGKASVYTLNVFRAHD